MQKPWDIKTEDKRDSDSRYCFYIFCEDRNTEPNYFQLFETKNIKIIPLEEQKSGYQNINNAITYCKENKLIIHNKNQDIWCVFDRDANINQSLNAQIDTEFEESVGLANNKGINVAWSNDVFELWFLLHFIDIDVNDIKYSHRTFIYTKLESVLKEVQNPSDSLKKIISNPQFNYESFMKRSSRMINIWKPILEDKRELAIKRARKLHLNQVSDLPISGQNPCTLVYKLVERLIEKG
jgi:hypothetical protein